MRQICDETGAVIQKGDIIRVFHFIGARRKKHYMYKYVTVKNDELYALHTGTLSPTESEGYYLWPEAARCKGDIEGTVILNYDDSRAVKITNKESK